MDPGTSGKGGGASPPRPLPEVSGTSVLPLFEEQLAMGALSPSLTPQALRAGARANGTGAFAGGQLRPVDLARLGLGDA